MTPLHGIIIDRRPTGGGSNGKLNAYVVQDETDGHQYTFDYTDIVTEGFRTIHIGERVRFHLSQPGCWKAEFIIRLDQPDPEVYYR